ncbi:MAG: hypothetical protein GYA24_21620 [Candidatus Lokiarchaeota archaeon]|nr:hypothetical protein [Candidatus Lokiarchaeota archaeon]
MSSPLYTEKMENRSFWWNSLLKKSAQNYEIRMSVTVAHEALTPMGELVCPVLSDEIRRTKYEEDNVAVQLLIPRLFKVEYPAIIDDLHILGSSKTFQHYPDKCCAKDVRLVLSILSILLPGYSDKDRARAQLQGFIDFLEKWTSRCEGTGEYMWFFL